MLSTPSNCSSGSQNGCNVVGSVTLTLLPLCWPLGDELEPTRSVLPHHYESVWAISAEPKPANSLSIRSRTDFAEHSTSAEPPPPFGRMGAAK